MSKLDEQNSNQDNKWKKFSEQQNPEPNDADSETSPQHDDQLAEQANTEELYNLGIEFPSRDDLETQLTTLEKKVDEYKNQAIRAQAELDNVRKRAERDISNAHKFGNEKLLQELLPVIDSLVRGIEGTPEGEARKGMELTLDLFEKTLTKFGVQAINPESGEPFDPTKHEAMSAQSDSDYKPDTIIQVMQRGYELHGRVLRAAMVMVAK